MFPRNKFVKQRVIVLSIFLIFIIAGVSMLLYVFSNNIALYSTPSAILNIAKNGDVVMLGGKVKNGSIKRLDNSSTIEFIIYEEQAEIKVLYQGMLPSLFKEGQDVVMRGKLNNNNVFEAEELLAKHDENYKPKRAM